MDIFTTETVRYQMKKYMKIEKIIITLNEAKKLLTVI